jgi:hypothetical protein
MNLWDALVAGFEYKQIHVFLVWAFCFPMFVSVGAALAAHPGKII